jgi:hypothetical protein
MRRLPVKRRTDIPAGDLPGSSWSAIALEYLAKLCAVAAVVLLFLVIVAIHHGRETKLAGQGNTAAFRTINGFFADRANFAAPARARHQLQTLNAVLTDLDNTSAGAVDLLASTLPDVQRLIRAGQGDLTIAQQLVPVAQRLREAGNDLRTIAKDADGTASAANRQVVLAKQRIDELNNQLAQIQQKLALLPAVPISPETGKRPLLRLSPGGGKQ